MLSLSSFIVLIHFVSLLLLRLFFVLLLSFFCMFKLFQRIQSNATTKTRCSYMCIQNIEILSLYLVDSSVLFKQQRNVWPPIYTPSSHRSLTKERTKKHNVLSIRFFCFFWGTDSVVRFARISHTEIRWNSMNSGLKKKSRRLLLDEFFSLHMPLANTNIETITRLEKIKTHTQNSPDNNTNYFCPLLTAQLLCMVCINFSHFSFNYYHFFSAVGILSIRFYMCMYVATPQLARSPIASIFYHAKSQTNKI